VKTIGTIGKIARRRVEESSRSMCRRADEALRDLVRSRDDAIIAQRRARQQLQALLLRTRSATWAMRVDAATGAGSRN